MNSRIREVCVFGLVGAALALGAVGCTAPATGADYLVDKADPYRGGVLWDRWWQVKGVKEHMVPGAMTMKGEETVMSSLPASSALYATNPAGNQLTGPDTWRCAECHGFDYKGNSGAYATGVHATGFGGVWAGRGKSAAEIFNAIRDGTGVSPDHAFSAVLSDTDVADLTRFIREGTVDVATLVDANGRALSSADADAGVGLYAAGCVSCHGLDGKTINFRLGTYDSEYVANTAISAPEFFIHQVRFGQPDGTMPNGSGPGYYLRDVTNILAHAQEMAPQDGLEVASAVRGGTLYDSWWNEKNLTEPATTNPLYLDPAWNTLGGAMTGSITWQCAECHGYDYKGKDGVFGSGEDATGIKGVMDSARLTVAQLRSLISAGRLPDGRVLVGHDFKQPGMLTDGDVNDLILFLREGLVDDIDYISSVTTRSKGSASSGLAKFGTNCATCHGPAGLRVNFARDDDEFATEYVANIARESPYELLHKIRFGRPGSDHIAKDLQTRFALTTGHMPNMFDANYTQQDVADILAYCQTLPGGIERGGAAFDTWWKVDHVAQPIEPGGSIPAPDGGTLSSSFPATNPLYGTNDGGSTVTGSDTWTCIQCHGWDALGRDGDYATGDNRTGFPGVFGARDLDPAVLKAAIASGQFRDGTTDPNHAFGAVLGDWLVRDMVKFVQNTIDYDREMIGRTGPEAKKVLPFTAFDATTDAGMKVRTRDANPLYGQIKFNSNCANCHGTDGRAKNFGEDEGVEEYLGDKARNNPWNVLHTASYSEPGSSPRMPNAAGTGYTLDDLADLLSYLSQLPGGTP